MRAKATWVKTKHPFVIDVVGTGGDGTHTFNISTSAALVVAAAGQPVAKHGNRAVSSKSGAADVLKALGVNIEASPEKVGECIDEVGVGFLFAPMLHGAMKHAIGPRRELAMRSIFNVMGPLTNPARAQSQLVGVYAPELTELVADVLRQVGCQKALVVHGSDGMDELDAHWPLARIGVGRERNQGRMTSRPRRRAWSARMRTPSRGASLRRTPISRAPSSREKMAPSATSYS